MKLLKRLATGLASIGIVIGSLGFAPAANAMAGETIVSGFSFPESAIHDPTTDRYIVSNSGNAPGAPAIPGYISRLSPSGQVLNAKWIDGSNAATPLNDPLGMAVYAGKLYIADIDYIRVFNVHTGQSLANIHIPGVTGLNDITPFWGGVIASDPGIDFSTNTPTGTDALYRVDGLTHQVSTLASGAQLANPNGLLYVPGAGLLVNPMSSPTIRIVNILNGNIDSFATLPDVGYDGAAKTGGSLYFNNPITGNLYKTNLQGGNVTLIGTYSAFPADINADTFRNRLLIPQLLGGSVIIKQL